MKKSKHLITVCWLVAASALVLILPSAPVQAGDWGISLDVPFIRVRSHDGYYYRDNDYGNRFSHYSHHYEPEQRYYYYPSERRHHDDDHYYDRWVGVDGRRYGEYRHR
jgi:hypothetical protein